ncbi:MAG: hypothetical protein QOE27_418 [Solirubrobacteraceae bacterium]|nr:hypothetical protein [Solirubrobacteraceae bacterium]
MAAAAGGPEMAGMPGGRRRSKWFLPIFVVVLGLVIFAAEGIGGHLDRGIDSLGIMAALAVALVLGGRSETVRGLRGDGRDERFALIDLRATALAGSVVTIAILIGWIVEIARGRDGGPYTWLATVAGGAYLVAIAFLRWRG